MTLHQYIENINNRYKLGNATEHTFRGDLQQLLESLVPSISATNEPKRQSCGAPDYILTKKEIPVGFIEAKDIGDNDLLGAKKTGNKEQFDRYKASLNNLIFTDYLDFHLYVDGVFVSQIAIAEVLDGSIIPLPDNFTAFTNLIKDFTTRIGQTIKSSKKLAEMMAGKARLLSDIIEKALTSDETHNENSTLKDQMNAFKEILIHDITPKGFADVYAQTIAYGMFAARLHDATLPTFSRQEAAELIPKSNPFLRKLFGYIAGPDLDDRIKWVVDSLVEIFLACNVAEILKNYGKSTKMEDPIIHFYETFLSEYDPKLRKARGVWYTPAPVVNFIVRAVDDILKTEFDLPQGLADTSKTKIKVDLQGKKVEQEVHKVQILDPATGTGTFLAEVVKHIHKKFQGQQGIWSNYVETHLLPRLNGFELLMASYAMAHLKLDLLLTETGYKPTTNQRFRVYLTNSLEEHHQDTGTLFANWLSTEANEANHIKRDTPVMCVIGNPPYAVSSTNKNDWIDNLIADYKKDLNEKSYNSLSDDYVKFIRYGQHYIEKNGSGVLAYISNNSFIDGIVFRQMRKHLLECFDKIYILDLHGNSKKKEVTLDGSNDENIFNIMQGVSVNIFIKTSKKSKNAEGQVFFSELLGKREKKYTFLNNSCLNNIIWETLDCQGPDHLFVQQNLKKLGIYNYGLDVSKLFNVGNRGTSFRKEDLLVKPHFTKESVEDMIESVSNLSDQEILNKYNFKETLDWTINDKRKYFKIENFKDIYKVNYKPFDYRFTYFPFDSINQIIVRGDDKRALMFHLIQTDNLGLIFPRQAIEGVSAWLTKLITENKILSAYNPNYIFPLYIYPELNAQQKIGQTEIRTPNLNTEIVNQIAKKVGLVFTNEKDTSTSSAPTNTFAPIDILDYIYAVLHSPTYREKYKEFLKIDFPRVPFPKDKNIFWQLVKLGGEIRQIHLLESPIVDKYITQYPIDGDNIVTKPRFEEYYEIIEGDLVSHVSTSYPIGRVYINETQFFQMVPKIAWEFYIGGYQPAQKWLKDRKGRQLEFEDILHYQKIIVALFETDRLMTEIDKIEIE